MLVCRDSSSESNEFARQSSPSHEEQEEASFQRSQESAHHKSFETRHRPQQAQALSSDVKSIRLIIENIENSGYMSPSTMMSPISFDRTSPD